MSGTRTRYRILHTLRALSAGIVLILIYSDSTSGSEPLASPPKGSILAFQPDPKSDEYSDLPSLKRWLLDQGWAICDGSDGTPNLNYRMLIGTIHPDEAGHNLGSRSHDHRNRADTGPAYGREHAFLTGRGRVLRVPEGGHRHRLIGTTESAEHLPLSLRVMFIMKVR